MAKYKLEFLKTAAKEFDKLPSDIQKRIGKKLESLTNDPYPSDIKALKNGNGLLRVRVANYRIIYRVKNDLLIIIVVKVGHRKNVYLNK